MKEFFRDLLVTAIIAAVIFIGLQATVDSFIVEGSSMQPTFYTGERLIVNIVSYRFSEPDRGDVIVFQPPNKQQGDYIKRIIGLPGEYVEIKGGKVYINAPNGEVFTLDEPYIADQFRGTYRGDIIPANSYFVLGDNRNNSDDSRNGWTVPRENIIGKAWLIVWPVDKFGFAKNHPFEQQVANANN